MRILSALALAATLALAAVAALPAATAQEHQHGDASGVIVAHDAPDSGREFVGNLAHFGVLDLGASGVTPQFHQQNHIRVSENGAVLMETTADSGHDYDGVNVFDVVFPVPGTYMVEDLAENGTALGMFMGTVVDPATAGGLQTVSLKLDAPATAVAGQAAQFTYSTVDAGGALVPHSDAWFEVRQGTSLVFRTMTHSHTEAQQLAYAFPAAGTYTVRITSFLAYPSPKAHLFAPLVTEKQVTVAANPLPALPTPQPGAATPDAPDTNKVVTGTGSGPYTMLGTYDPYTTVGTYTQEHLTALVMDPMTRHPVPHVDFKATLASDDGTILFSSQTLHAYDGIYEFTAVEPVGHYSLSVDASRGNWTSHMDMPYTVLPPVEPVAVDVPPMPGLGPIFFDVSGLSGATAGSPVTLVLANRDAAGQPFPHSEVDYQVLGANKVPVVAGKLHTHSDGKFQLTARLPAGAYTLRLSPFPLDPEATPAFYGKNLGDPLDLPFTVAPGPGIPAAPVADASAAGSATHAAPAAGLLVGVLLVGLAAIARRR